MKRVLFVLIFVVISLVVILTVLPKQKNFETKREILLSQLYENIEDAAKIGRYKCCVEPPCTMCYLGNWIWEDGSCYCDEMIVKGEFDKVCPQCKKGIEEGKCISTDKTRCKI